MGLGQGRGPSGQLWLSLLLAVSPVRREGLSWIHCQEDKRKSKPGPHPLLLTAATCASVPCGVLSLITLNQGHNYCGVADAGSKLLCAYNYKLRPSDSRGSKLPYLCCEHINYSHLWQWLQRPKLRVAMLSKGHSPWPRSWNLQLLGLCPSESEPVVS